MIKKLVENIIWQADYFLKECGEFYPFASVISRNGEIKPLGILLENDKPSPEEVLKELTQVLQSGLVQKEYKAFAIGINTSFISESNLSENVKMDKNLESKEFKDVIEIRIQSEDQMNEEILRLPYNLNHKTHEIRFGDFLNPNV